MNFDEKCVLTTTNQFFFHFSKKILFCIKKFLSLRHVTPAVMGNLEILTKNVFWPKPFTFCSIWAKKKCFFFCWKIFQKISKSQTRYTCCNGKFWNFDQKCVLTKTNHFLFHLSKKIINSQTAAYFCQFLTKKHGYKGGKEILPGVRVLLGGVKYLVGSFKKK